jgi:pimeloyl-ACP methyl ester carboxylesterase
MNLPQLTIQGKGQPFIWLHGMLNSVESDSVYSLIDLEQLSKVVSLVRYDFCDKSVNGDYSWDALTDELINVADSLHLNQMILGGTSMGAAISLHAAVRFPERVKALVLVTPPPAWENRNGVKAVYQKIASKTNQGSIPDFLRRMIQLNQDLPEFFEQQNPETQQRLIECRLGFAPKYYSQIYLGGAASDLPARHLIAQIRKPTLIVALPDDVNHPLEMAEELNSLIVNSEMVVVSNHDEYMNLQKTVRDFIDLVP